MKKEQLCRYILETAKEQKELKEQKLKTQSMSDKELFKGLHISNAEEQLKIPNSSKANEAAAAAEESLKQHKKN